MITTERGTPHSHKRRLKMGNNKDKKLYSLFSKENKVLLNSVKIDYCLAYISEGDYIKLAD